MKEEMKELHIEIVAGHLVDLLGNQGEYLGSARDAIGKRRTFVESATTQGHLALPYFRWTVIGEPRQYPRSFSFGQAGHNATSSPLVPPKRVTSKGFG